MKTLALMFLLLIPSISAAGQNILVNGKLPKDLQITIDDTGTLQFADTKRSTISSDGRVVFHHTSQSLPLLKNPADLLALKTTGSEPKKKPGKLEKTLAKPPKNTPKKDKLSKKQLFELVQAIELSGFFEMQDRYHGNPTLKTSTCINHSKAKAISVLGNGKTKTVYFFLGCSYGEFETLTKFLRLYDQIAGAISSVKAKEIRPPEAVPADQRN